jgi:hypothetical protein
MNVQSRNSGDASRISTPPPARSVTYCTGLPLPPRITKPSMIVSDAAALSMRIALAPKPEASSVAPCDAINVSDFSITRVSK